jgi:hypothetical protein
MAARLQKLRKEDQRNRRNQKLRLKESICKGHGKRKEKKMR